MEVEQSRQGFFSITLTVKWRRLSSQPASLVQWPVSSFQISAFLAVWLWPTHGTSHFFACKMCVGLWRLDDVNHAPRMQQWHRREEWIMHGAQILGTPSSSFNSTYLPGPQLLAHLSVQCPALCLALSCYSLRQPSHLRWVYYVSFGWPPTHLEFLVLISILWFR